MSTDSGGSSPETPKKRIKADSSTLENSSPASLPSVKGKSKLEFETNCCGICFSEAGQDDNNSVSRGCIDSCNHYFCFVCIMEWAKVESKCPLCKRRFSTIRRPAKPPVLPSERLIHVPVRDQVYHYYGNVTTGTHDPYSEAKCSICNSVVNESLLLLCDLCDSASHTYCVGLGEMVPEGDWFCNDCTLLRDERTKAEMDTDAEDQENSCNLNESSSKEKVAVFDIVRGPCTRVVDRSSASQMQFNVARNSDGSLDNDLLISVSRSQERTTRAATKLAARTLRQCRNVHERIKLLRDNWNSIRNGSLSFPSRKNEYGHTAGRKPIICATSVQSSSVSCSSENAKSSNGCPTEPGNTIQSVSTSGTGSIADYYDISKAWKMMDKAKSIDKRKSTLPSKGSSKLLLSNSNIKGSGNLATMRKGNTSDCYNGENHNLLKPQMLERRNLASLECENNITVSLIAPSPINCGLISSHSVLHSVQHNFQDGSDRSYPDKTSFESLHTASNYCGSSTSMSSSDESATAASNLFHARNELQSLPSCKSEPSIAKGAEEKIPAHSNMMRNDDAKSEIQSLVKLNLKLLTKDQKLETNLFKQVARSATHSILVACGLESPKPGIRWFSSSACCHNESNLQFQRSTLMPSSCQECFFVFAKDVVNTIMLEKVGNGNLS